MTLAGRIAWDDSVLPFQLDRADVRGRVARLDRVLETILGLAADLAPDYFVLYNGPECGAYAPDHLHFQAC